MKKIAIVILLIGFISSCGTKKQTVPSSKESAKIALGKIEKTHYKSLGNGVADIDLKLFENNTFVLDIKSIPQPESKEKAFKIYEKGTYTKEGKWFVLTFIKPKFSVESIFDTSFSTQGDFEIEGEKVKINSEKDGIMIWGIFCEKN